MSPSNTTAQIKKKLFDLKVGDRFRFTGLNEEEFTITKNFRDSIGRIVYFTDGKESFATTCCDEVWHILPVTGGFEVNQYTEKAKLGEVPVGTMFQVPGSINQYKTFKKTDNFSNHKHLMMENVTEVMAVDEYGQCYYGNSTQDIKIALPKLYLKDLVAGERFRLVKNKAYRDIYTKLNYLYPCDSCKVLMPDWTTNDWNQNLEVERV